MGLAGFSRAWIQLQNIARTLWNFLQLCKLTPEAVALLFVDDPLALPLVAAGSVLPGTLLVQPKERGSFTDKPSAKAPAKKKPADDVDPAARRLALPSILVSLELAADSLMDFGDVIKAGGPVVLDSVRPAPFQLEQLVLNNDLGPQASFPAKDCWFVPGTAESNLNWCVRVVVFAIEACFHACLWHRTVRLGKRLIKLTAGMFADSFLKVVRYAQERIIEAAQDDLERTNAILEGLESKYASEKAVIEERKLKRRSQRGKREEDANMANLLSEYSASREPFDQRHDRASADFQREDALLDSFLELARQAETQTKPYLLALDAARYKMQRFYMLKAKIGFFAEGAVTRVGRQYREGGPDMSADLPLLPGQAPAAPALATLHAQVVSAYRGAQRDLREHGENMHLCRALNELGDFLLNEGQREAAFGCYHDCLDAALGMHNALPKRTEVLAQERFDESDEASASPESARELTHLRYVALLNKVGFWRCISGALACAKLARYTNHSNMDMRHECVLFAAALLNACLSGSLATPPRTADFARVTLQELSPGVADLLNMSPFRVRIGSLLEALELVSTELVRHAPLGADRALCLPVLCFYEHVASTRVGEAFHVLNAQVLKAQALLDLGELGEAAKVLGTLLRAGDVVKGPFLPTLPSGQSLLRGFSLPTLPVSEVKDAKAAKATEVVTLPEVAPRYLTHLAPTHSSNVPFLKHICEPSVGALDSPQAAVFGPFLWSEVVLLKVRFLLRCAAFGDPLGYAGVAEEDAADLKKDKKKDTKKGAPKGASPTPVGEQEVASLMDVVAALQLRNELLGVSEQLLLAILTLHGGNPAHPIRAAELTEADDGGATVPKPSLLSGMPAYVVTQCYSMLSLVVQLQGDLSTALGWNQRALQTLHAAGHIAALIASATAREGTGLGAIFAPLANRDHWRSEPEPRMWLRLRVRRVALLIAQGRLLEATSDLDAGALDATKLNASYCVRLFARQRVLLDVVQGKDHGSVERALLSLCKESGMLAGPAEAAEVRLSLVAAMLASGRPAAAARWLSEASRLMARHFAALDVDIARLSPDTLAALPASVLRGVFGADHPPPASSGPLAVVPPALIGSPYAPGLSLAVLLASQQAAIALQQGQLAAAFAACEAADRVLATLFTASPLAQALLDRHIGTLAWHLAVLERLPRPQLEELVVQAGALSVSRTRAGSPMLTSRLGSPRGATSMGLASTVASRPPTSLLSQPKAQEKENSKDRDTLSSNQVESGRVSALSLMPSAEDAGRPELLDLDRLRAVQAQGRLRTLTTQKLHKQFASAQQLQSLVTQERERLATAVTRLCASANRHVASSHMHAPLRAGLVALTQLCGDLGASTTYFASTLAPDAQRLAAGVALVFRAHFLLQAARCASMRLALKDIHALAKDSDAVAQSLVAALPALVKVPLLENRNIQSKLRRADLGLPLRVEAPEEEAKAKKGKKEKEEAPQIQLDVSDVLHYHQALRLEQERRWLGSVLPAERASLELLDCHNPEDALVALHWALKTHVTSYQEQCCFDSPFTPPPLSVLLLEPAAEKALLSGLADGVGGDKKVTGKEGEERPLGVEADVNYVLELHRALTTQAAKGLVCVQWAPAAWEVESDAWELLFLLSSDSGRNGDSKDKGGLKKNVSKVSKQPKGKTQAGSVMEKEEVPEVKKGPTPAEMITVGLQGARRLAKTCVAELLTRCSRLRHKVQLLKAPATPGEDLKIEFTSFVLALAVALRGASDKAPDAIAAQSNVALDSVSQQQTPVGSAGGGKTPADKSSTSSQLSDLVCSAEVMCRLELLLDASEGGGLCVVDPVLCQWLHMALGLVRKTPPE
jgi:hypothetical protein